MRNHISALNHSLTQPIERRFSQSLARFGLALAIILSLTSGQPARAGDNAAAQPVDKTTAKRARLNDQILRLSQPLKCSADTDCASIALGAKPCGGPWKYILYSKKNSKVPALKKKVAEYNQLDQKINQAQNTMSDCMVTMAPEAKCVNAMCVDARK